MEDPSPTPDRITTFNQFRAVHARATGLEKPTAPPVPPPPLLIDYECPGVEGAGPPAAGAAPSPAWLARADAVIADLAKHNAPPSPTSLDTQESSVRGDFDRFWSEKGTPAEFFKEPMLDENSLSSSFRHSGWQTIRRHVFEALQRTGQNNARRASFGSCGSFSWLEQHNTDMHKFRVRHNHCNDRLCTPCANQRSMVLRDALLNAIGKTPCSFITLTLCGKEEPLTDLIDRLYKHFRALRLHPLWSDKVRGGAAFLEIKYSDKAGRWHPHLHIIADADFIPQGELSTVWRTITKDSYIVDVRRVKDPETTGRYVTKYASKPLNTSFANSPALLDEAIRAFKGRRLCLTFGTWYGTPLTDAEDDDLDLSDKNDWHCMYPLEDLLASANRGEREAVQIVKLAGIEGLWRAMLNCTPPPT